MDELVNTFMESNISPILKGLIILILFGAAVYNLFLCISTISWIVSDLRDTKDLNEMDEYIKNHTCK